MATTMKAWLFKSAKGGLEHNLFLPAAGAPRPRISDHQILVEVYSAALNPADYKLPELGSLVKGQMSSTATPGMDFCGKVAETGAKIDSFRVGQMVFGTALGARGQGSLAQYIPVSLEMLTSMPDGLNINEAAGVGVAGITAYQAIQPYVKEGDSVFINGGSGGTGIFGIQIAKALGCHVTTSCSSANVELCKSLGADEVIDYKSTDVATALQEKGPIFSLAVDNVGSPLNLYKISHKYLLPEATFIQIGAGVSIAHATQLASNMLLPGLLGGGKRKYQFHRVKNSAANLAQIGKWMEEKKVRTVIDEVFEFENVPKAFERLKTNRAKGKVVVRVKKE